MTTSRAAAETVDATPESGIIWIYHFDADGCAELVPREAADQALADQTGWTWVHLSLADARCRVWIAQNTRLSELAREMLVGPDEHLRLDLFGHEIVGVVPDLQQEIAQATDAIVRLRFAMTERLLVTVRRTPVHSVEINRHAIEAGKRFPSAVSLLDAVIDHFADAVGHMAERLGSELDTIEDTVMGDEPPDHRPRIGRVRLQAVRVHRQLSLLRGMFHRLEPRVAAQHPAVAQAMRALAQKLDAIDQEVGSLQERARLLLEEVAARMTEITNRRLFTLSVLTACLLPPTLVTGFFGMNTKDLPWQNTDGGTWMAFGVALIASAASYWALRRMRAF
ncbi:MAG TPA: CorA family divalent cation transporter [Pseudolabrys sp.]|nr:CorA family divalent cation transporter [Pseudolabrys sp.]